jgi:hypothetical protein
VGLKPSRKLAGSVIGPKREVGRGAAPVELMSKDSNLVVAPLRGARKPAVATLIESSEAAGIWTIQTGIFPENTASLALHERAGFRVVGTRERIGCHHGEWRDVVLIERRSAAAGR